MDTTEVLRGETHAATSVRDSAIPVRQVFRREGEYWTIEYAGTVCRLRDAAGLRYLAFLLGRPGEKVPATDDSAATDRQYHPVLAVDPAGGFLVVWEGHNLTRNFVDFSGIFAQRYDDSGRRIGEEFQINSPATRFAGSPAMATDSAGNLVVVWEGGSAEDSAAGIFGRRYDAAGAAAGDEFQVSNFTTDAQFAPAVATGVAGEFVVVWQRAAFYTSQVVGCRYDSGGTPIGGVFPVTADSGYTHASPTVATLPSGGFLVVWERDDLTQLFFGPGDIVAQRYSASGAPRGGELVVSGVRTGHQGSPAVTANASGNVVVAWHGLPGDGSEPGIFGRRYTVSSLTQRTGCAGDCDGNHRVTIAELVSGINLSLDDGPLDTCPASDADGDSQVTITDLVKAVDDALSGCQLTVSG